MGMGMGMGMDDVGGGPGAGPSSSSNSNRRLTSVNAHALLAQKYQILSTSWCAQKQQKVEGDGQGLQQPNTTPGSYPTGSDAPGDTYTNPLLRVPFHSADTNRCSSFSVTSSHSPASPLSPRRLPRTASALPLTYGSPLKQSPAGSGDGYPTLASLVEVRGGKVEVTGRSDSHVLCDPISPSPKAHGLPPSTPPNPSPVRMDVSSGRATATAMMDGICYNNSNSQLSPCRSLMKTNSFAGRPSSPTHPKMTTPKRARNPSPAWK
mmetsp:Transcript_31059/g.50240  ORF Transcript_31059/g.50240 Transcript_31059/m.50240 type:complete len:264 (-) Transcript_31059:823-1614(-)